MGIVNCPERSRALKDHAHCHGSAALVQQWFLFDMSCCCVPSVGGISQTPAPMRFGIHPTKYDEFLCHVFTSWCSTSLGDIRPLIFHRVFNGLFGRVTTSGDFSPQARSEASHQHLSLSDEDHDCPTMKHIRRLKGGMRPSGFRVSVFFLKKKILFVCTRVLRI